MAYIETISPLQAGGELKNIYERLVQSRGKIAEVHKIQSLNPKALLTHMDLYMVIMFGKSPLKRYQREMLGVIVSAINKCNYCVNHHEQALLAYWKEKKRTEQLINNRDRLNLSDHDRILCELAESLTTNESADYSDQIETLKSAGFDDRAILDAVQVIAYFNFVNRIVLGLGVTSAEEEIKGYKY